MGSEMCIRDSAEPAQAAETGAPAAEQPTPEEQGEFDFFGDTDGAEG